MKTIQELAGEMFDAFESKTRDSGETYYVLKDGSPDWMKEIVHKAHGDMLPDDYRYSWTQDACGAIHDAGDVSLNDLDDVGSEFADNVDVYNSALLKWVSSNLTRMGYVDEAMEEVGFKQLANALMYGQSQERREVFDAVKEGLIEYFESQEEDEGEDESE